LPVPPLELLDPELPPPELLPPELLLLELPPNPELLPAPELLLPVTKPLELPPTPELEPATPELLPAAPLLEPVAPLPEPSPLPEDDPPPPVLVLVEGVDEHAAITAASGTTMAENEKPTLGDMVKRMVTLPRESQCASLWVAKTHRTKKPTTELRRHY